MNLRKLFLIPLLTIVCLFSLILAGCAPINMTDEDATATSDESATDATSDTTTVENPPIATVNVRSLRVRNASGDNADVISGVKQNESFVISSASEDGNWLELEMPLIPEGKGWVKAEFVVVSGDVSAITGVPSDEEASSPPAVEPDSTQAPATTGQRARVATDGTRLRVRRQPQTEAEIVGYIYNDETYAVISLSADGQWVQIAGAEQQPSDNPNGGWVTSEFLVIE